MSPELDIDDLVRSTMRPISLSPNEGVPSWRCNVLMSRV